MIPFRLPQLSMSLSQYTEIVALQRRAGSCVAFLIGLGEKFFSSGVTLIGTSFLLSSAEYLLMSPPGLFHHMQCYSGSHWR